MPGQAGHIFIISAFISVLLSWYGYKRAAHATGPEAIQSWGRFARAAFFLHGFFVIGAIASLFYILFAGHYEYHYAWSHSSRDLPLCFMISCFWEGQEGSFLVWIFWNFVLGLLLLASPSWEEHLMKFFTLSQVFLLSMLLGILVPFLDLKIGSSPFILLKEKLHLPVFDQNPDYVPPDGTGLNSLLQNIWMVIHPPVIFLGYAITTVPFCYCLAGLTSRRYKEWIAPAFPWILASVLVLGSGIVMGAYWAYETLNFEGYWSWDPVENAVYIPWLMMIAAIHGVVLYNKKGRGLKIITLLVSAGFLLIIYSAFLTRSGILGNASVHTFTDLGLSGQLIFFLITFFIMSVYLIYKSWNFLSVADKTDTSDKSAFFILIGIIVLALSAFQVLIPTSIPVYNALINFFGGNSALAPPADSVIFYSSYQIYFAILISALASTGQLFYWKNSGSFFYIFSLPLLITVPISALIVLSTGIVIPVHMLFIASAVYAVVSSVVLLIRLSGNQKIISAGLFSHAGMAVMLIGILFSTAYANNISADKTGSGKGNVFLLQDQPQKLPEGSVVYKGSRVKINGMEGYADAANIFFIGSKAYARENFSIGKNIFRKGDPLPVKTGEKFYEVEYTDGDGKEVSVFPAIENNPRTGYTFSPGIQHFFSRDIYVHVANLASSETDEREKIFTVAMQDTFRTKNFSLIFHSIKREDEFRGYEDPASIALAATIEISKPDGSYYLHPLFLIKNNSVTSVPAESKKDGMKIALVKVDPQHNQFTFSFLPVAPDWIVVKILEKPFIGLVWLGAVLMLSGVMLSVYRRVKERTTTGMQWRFLLKTLQRSKEYSIIENKMSYENK